MDTIFALCTPAGKSGVAVVRVSGTKATTALKAMNVPLPQPRTATLATLRMGKDAPIDRALVPLFSSAP